MFTGIIERLAQVQSIRQVHDIFRLELRMGDVGEELALGESVSVNGVCLTAVSSGQTDAAFEVVPETISKTTLSTLRVGDRVNIERALRVGDRIGGHFVSGHVDGIGCVIHKAMTGQGAILRVQTEEAITRQMILKGSVALDGISLTLTAVDPQEFAIAIVPHTLQATTLGFRNAGDLLNIEVDMMGKWARKLLAPVTPDAAEPAAKQGLSTDAIQRLGIVLPNRLGSDPTL